MSYIAAGYEQVEFLLRTLYLLTFRLVRMKPGQPQVVPHIMSEVVPILMPLLKTSKLFTSELDG